MHCNNVRASGQLLHTFAWPCAVDTHMPCMAGQGDLAPILLELQMAPSGCDARTGGMVGRSDRTTEVGGTAKGGWVADRSATDSAALISLLFASPLYIFYHFHLSSLFLKFSFLFTLIGLMLECFRTRNLKFIVLCFGILQA